MTNWTASADSDPVVEGPNALVYVTYSSDDGRKRLSIRTSYEDEQTLLEYIAGECQKLSAQDDRAAQMATMIVNGTIRNGPITLPDISARLAERAAKAAYEQKVSAALTTIRIREAQAEDPSIPDKP